LSQTEPVSSAKRVDVTDVGLSALAFAAGATDVMAFLTLSGVFTAAMTGNMAFLGIAASRADWTSAVLSLSALAGFVAGVAVAAALYGAEPSRERQWTTIRSLLLLEIAGLVVFAVAWTLADHPIAGVPLYCIILLSAFCMGIQSVAARHINVPGVNTIVFTITLVGVIARLTRAAARETALAAPPGSAARQSAVIAAYAFGALLAGVVIWFSNALLPWLSVAAVAVAIACYEIARSGEEVR
jgi:uncharacterized membrane protein YoaK (UPF0700 family)